MLYVHRTFGVYSHYGIYIGKEGCEVIHFSGPSKCDVQIKSCTVEEFCDGGQLRLVAYNDAASLFYTYKRMGSSHHEPSDPAEDVIKRAEYYPSNPDEWGSYHLLHNNCEMSSTARQRRNIVSRFQEKAMVTVTFPLMLNSN